MNSRTLQNAVAGKNDCLPIDVEVLQTLFDITPDLAFFIKDNRGRYLAVNESLVSRHGLTRKSDALGKRPQDICPGDFGRIPSEQDFQILQTGIPLIDHLELQWQRPREAVWCLTTKLPIRNAIGHIVGIIGFSRDVRAPLQRNDIPKGLATALEEFERTLSSEVTPANLARRAGITSQRLLRLMKYVFGVTTAQFLLKTRISAASRLLQETNLSITAIAQSCGFYDHSAFSRTFRCATGFTPSDFRDQTQKRSSRSRTKLNKKVSPKA
ncbi:AraC family transcriptional regulator [Telmatocola sphagniphila]|uniref:AraC family transcriptional regulator n=1 Tax=Telmatocola sphagniphila TaxID=1123043 RepID=A0A8E6B6V8_9BACT|nr:AraC family transcriptional regulator [Telmatocola sphagniphila]QVL33210.1 AraC family transcriptional regulator [Telmatocola sphagniphila]